MESTVECRPIKNKPVVYYQPDPLDIIVLGRSAFITPINHYNGDMVSNTTVVRTSSVLVYDENTGEFETKNTIYVPKKLK